jgi:hypothetical protein
MGVGRRGRLASTAVVILLAGGVLCAVAAAAAKSGGGSIASAPLVNPSSQEFGNTADGVIEGNTPADYWKLQLISGDHVKIDWESQQGSCGGGCGWDYADTLQIWPSGTTDYSINNTSSLQNFGIGDNAKAESSFTAPGDGTYPVTFVCYNCSADQGGPYDFTAYVQHHPILAFVVPKKVKNGHAVVVQAHYPDGNPITGSDLSIQVWGKWGTSVHLLGSSSPVGGKAAITLRIPRGVRGKLIYLRALASASNFTTAHTAWHRALVH